MTADMQCPYCGADQEVCHDDGAGYSEDVRHEHTCSNCSKSFVFETAISFHYTPRKADCLNGLPHQLKMTSTTPKEYTRWVCKDCDHAQPLTESEMMQLLETT